MNTRTPKFKTITIKAGRRRPMRLHNLWIKWRVLKIKITHGHALVSVRCSSDSLYGIRSVGGDNDMKDFLKVCGTMTVANLFKKQREDLVAFRRESTKGDWLDHFALASYWRPHRDDPGGFDYGAVKSFEIGEIASQEISLKYFLPVGFWAGGDFELTTDLTLEISIEPLNDSRLRKAIQFTNEQQRAINIPRVVQACPSPEPDEYCINESWCKKKGFCLRCD